MPGHDIIVVGASAGGIEALTALMRGLPADLPAAVFVVLHLPPDAVSVLPRLLSRAGPLPALPIKDGAPIQRGRIYVASPDHHLLVHFGYVELERGPRVHGHRPAVDPLFRSAAAAYGDRVVGVVLSGSLNDGTIGLAAIKARGGIAVVQDPEEASYPGMPASAVKHVDVDFVLPVHQIPAVLDRLSRDRAGDAGAAMTDILGHGEESVARDVETWEHGDGNAQTSTLTCPECGGVLWELRDGELLQFRCHTGHVYSAETLDAGQSEMVEVALWHALRALSEKEMLNRKLAERLGERGSNDAGSRFSDTASVAAGAAAVLRGLLGHKLSGEDVDRE